jgi:acetyltransferase-like isoleucine patch superfamily enzyme
MFFKILRRIGILKNKLQQQFHLRVWHVLYKHRFSCGPDFVNGKMFGLYFDSSSSNVKIGTAVQFRNGCQIRTGMNGKLAIGNRVFFNNYCSITCFNSITIGDDCQFGESVKFYDHNHQYKATDKLINQQGYSTGSIKIGNNCWFGSDVIILKNVEIGDNVIIGAGCIIHESIPEGSVIINKQKLIML